MITNERQYRITNAQLAKLREALGAFDSAEAAERIGSQQLATAEHDALESQVEELTEQIREYEALKSGAVSILKAESIEGLPTILIRARIAKRLSQRDLAKMLGLKEQQIQRYEAGSYASASLRRLAEVARALDLEISEIAEVSTALPRENTGEGRLPVNWSEFPFQEMYRKNWFESFFAGSLDDARSNAEELLRKFVHRTLQRSVPAFLRAHVRVGSRFNRWAFFAWQCRVVARAKKQPLEKAFRIREASEEWLGELVCCSRFPDGPRRAERYLIASGIHFVVEPHLQHTYLDGAALLMPGGIPVVALTLRYDRLDNFWFVLLHEVLHVIRHLRKGKTECFLDNLDIEPDQVEREADQLAGEALIPKKVWETALARYLRSEESIVGLAKEVGISPAIVAGRIRREANNYTILTQLIGQGEVRNQFREVEFGQ